MRGLAKIGFITMLLFYFDELLLLGLCLTMLFMTIFWIIPIVCLAHFGFRDRKYNPTFRTLAKLGALLALFWFWNNANIFAYLNSSGLLSEIILLGGLLFYGALGFVPLFYFGWRKRNSIN